MYFAGAHSVIFTQGPDGSGLGASHHLLLKKRFFDFRSPEDGMPISSRTARHMDTTPDWLSVCQAVSGSGYIPCCISVFKEN